ncbi:MAG: hypothetical protein K2O31_05735, partial [Clostridia bacterium]|nr:hypothetical protein [Clostridia bacterium]
MEDVAKNNDTLGELYALRAGLSVISQSADELAKANYEKEKTSDEFIKSKKWCLSLNGYPIEEIGKWVLTTKEFNGYYKRLEDLKNKADCPLIYSKNECNQKDIKLGEKVFQEWLKTEEPKETIKYAKESELKAIRSYKKDKIKEEIISIFSAVI